MSRKNSRKNQSFPASTLVLLVLVLALGAGLVVTAFVAPDAAAEGAADLTARLRAMLPGSSGSSGSSDSGSALSAPGEDGSPSASETAAVSASVSRDPVTAATGNAGDVRYAASYTVTAAEGAAVSAKTVVSAGGSTLTNAGLQVYYLSEVASWRAGGHDENPDFSQPLDCQVCPLAEGGLSWQHYFLNRAVQSWCLEQAAANAAAQPQPITEEAYQPFEDLHAKYIAEDLPVNDFLYQDQDCYKPNKLHQAYLDELPEKLEELAQALGYQSLTDYCAAVYGTGVSAQDVVDAAESTNLAYMYFTEKSYYLEDEDTEAVRTVSSGCTVDLRQVLLIPEGAQVAADGTVTASEEAWEACLADAQSKVDTWRADFLTNQNAEANFARLANTESADAGSRLNGGFYTRISEGQMIDAVDRWAFSSSRIVGDVEVVRSELGVHILYLSGVHPAGEAESEQAQLCADMKAVCEEWLADVKCTVDYSAAALWCDADAAVIDPDDILYPDVAHERYPEAITFLQQDYMYTSFGSAYVGRGGCGITTAAMLATYMTDTLQTPAMMAERFSRFSVGGGTDGDIFRYMPAEMGFYMEKTSFDIDEVVEALKNGQRVISLQQLGVFTSGGHYLLIQAYNEENDTFQIRDSNTYNYGKLAGHKVDYFTRSDLASGMVIFYIMQNKIVRIPACDRCGDTFSEREPELLLNSEYTCEKCLTALARRNAWLSMPDSVTAV